MPPKKKAKSPKPSSPSKSPLPPTEDIKDAYYGLIEINVYYLDCKYFAGSLAGIMLQLEPGMYTLVVVYANNYVGRVGRIHVSEEGCRVDINRKFYLYIKAMDNYIMDTLLSTPFFFSLIKGENRADPKLFPKLGFAAAIQTNVVGQGNLGIMPLLTGQFEMESLIVLEPPGIQEIYYFERQFSEHPRLYVKLVDGKKNLSAKELNNIMWLSVESVYNLDDSNFLQDAEHTLVFPLPTKSIDEEHALLEELFAVGEDPYEEVRSESKRSSKKGKKMSPRKKSPKNKNRESNDAPKRIEIKNPQDFDLIQFDRGIYKIEQTPDIRKKWSSLASINGAPAMTDQRILTDSYDLISTVPFDVVKKYRSCIEPRIEWNMVRPIWLHDDLENLMKERIMQYGVWPIEVLMLGKVFLEKEQLMMKKFKKNKKTVEILKSEIDNILSEFQEVIETFDIDEDDPDPGDASNRLSEIAVRIQELLSKYGNKPKRNIQAHKQKEHEKTKSNLSRESSASEEFESETYEDPNEFLKEDSVVVLQRKSYIVWIDLSPLLVPGCTHLRTAGALQHFNRAEAVAKWGLTNTFSGDTGEMSTYDKELSRMLRRETTDINKIYTDLKKKKLIKCPTKSLLLLERLLELSYKIKKIESEPELDLETQVFSSHIREDEDKKKMKSQKSRDDKKKIKIGKQSKVKPDGLMKEKSNTRNLSPKSGQLKKDSTLVEYASLDDTDSETEDELELETDSLTENVFDFNKIRKQLSKEKTTPKTPTSGTGSSAISGEQAVEEEENMLKIKTMKHYFNRPASHSQHLFTANKTDKVKKGKIMESLKKDASSVEEISLMQSMDSSPTELFSSSESSITDLKKLTVLQPDSKLVNKHKPDQKTPDNQLRNDQEFQSPVENPPKKISLQVQSSQPTASPGMEHLNEEEPLLELLKSLLVTVVNKYRKLKERYKVLKKIKVKKGESTLDTSDLETINLPSANDKNRDIRDEYLPLNDELGIIKVDPRHKMWQVGQHLNDELMDDQIQYTNDVRKMAVLENDFLLLKRLRLAQMKKRWEQKLKDIMPEYLENSKGEKVIVIIDIKLLKPLVPKPILAAIDLEIQDFVKVKETKKNPVYFANDSVVQFHNCITNLSNLITSEYQDFKKIHVSVINPLSGETGNEFYEYLEKSRAHQIITESLSETMKGYLASALRDPIPAADKNDQKKLRYYVGWLYSRVVDEMQSVVNKTIIEGDPSLPETNFGDLPAISSYDHYLFAVEAIEEMDYDRAKYYLAKRLEGKNVNEPRLWIDYAVIALRIGDYQRAMECIKESLILDSRYKEGLIMYAVMLMTEGRFEDAQLFFNALINFYPMFVEGWMAFHMFYLITENKTGADITLVAGTKISYDFKLPIPMKPPQLSWDNKTWIEDEPGNYISTAIYFLSFNMYEIAEVCLARELERVGTKTLVWVYHLSVCHYIQGRYEDSAKHLSKAIQELQDYNMDPRVWMLLGHNCWMMGLKKCAIQMYLHSFTKKKENLFDHMTYIRCGFFFLEKEHNKFAKQMFLRAVRQQSTPMGWLGLGITLFMEGKIEDAELALREANMLDTTLATAWGYLALVSLYKLKEEQFIHCFREAKRYGLDDKKLLFHIEIISQQIESYRKSRLYEKSESSY